MNTNTIERIAHEEAVKAADRSGRDWMALSDYQSLRDLERELASKKGVTEEEAREALAVYFENLITDLDYYDEQEAHEEEETKTVRTYGWTRTVLQLSKRAEAIYSETDPLQILEIETADGAISYAMSGCVEASGISADEVEAILISLGEEIDDAE